MANPKDKNKKRQAESDDVFQPPEILREPGSRQVRLGGKLNLRITATGRPLPDYQWYLNGKKISGANSDRLYVHKTRRDHGGTYTCEVKNYAGKLMSRAAIISFLVEKIPALVVEPAQASIPAGQPFSFRITSPSREVLQRFKFQWTFNGKRIAGAIGPELQLSEVKKKYEGEYKVVIIAGSEIHTSNPARLLVTGTNAKPEEILTAPKPVPEVIAAAPAPKTEDFFFNPEEESDPEEETALPREIPKAPALYLVASPPRSRHQRKRAFLERLLARWERLGKAKQVDAA